MAEKKDATDTLLAFPIAGQIAWGIAESLGYYGGGDDYILREDGTQLLREDGSYLLREG